MEQPKQWSKQELIAWKNFWESEEGNIAISKIKALSDAFGFAALQTIKSDEVVACTGRKAGVEAVLSDIQVGIEMANAELKKNEEETAERNK